MTIQDWGSIGELVAAIATVATLAYLAIQIRAGARASRAQSGQARNASSKQQLLALAQDQHLAGVYRRGLADFESLEPDEQMQFAFLIHSFLSDSYTAFADMKLGVTDRSTFDDLWMGFRSVLSRPGAMEVWRRTASGYTSEFRAFVDSDLSRDGPRAG